MIRTDAGSAPLSMALGLGLFVIPVLLLVLTIPTWESRMVDARDAAAAAARALVVSDSWSEGVAAADQAVSEVAANDALSPDELSVSYGGALVRGGSVSAAVTVTVPAGQVPGIGTFGAVHYTAVSTQHVDDYRSFG